VQNINVEETNEYMMARVGMADRWVPACGGHEKPFKTRCGRTLLYVYNFKLGMHAYLDVGTDILLSQEEANRILG